MKETTLLILNDSLFIAKGGERACYTHPEDESKLIKVQYSNNLGRHQNILDLFYYKSLTQRVRDFTHIPTLYGHVDTNLGQGLIFSAIKDYNFEFSKTFEDVVREKDLSSSHEMTLLFQLKHYLTEHLIVFGDVVLSNILCQEYEPGSYKLVIVDGLGARRFNFKFWLQNHSKIYTKIRMRKQYQKLMANYHQLKAL